MRSLITTALVLFLLIVPAFAAEAPAPAPVAVKGEAVRALDDGRILHSIAFLDEPIATLENFTALMAEAESAIRKIQP